MPVNFNHLDYFSRVLIKAELVDYGTGIEAGDFIPISRGGVPGFVDPDTFAGVPGATGDTGPAGNDGPSAYDVWIAEGNAGTELDFLNTLVGPTGATGPTGPSGTTTVDESAETALASPSTVIDLTGADAVVNLAAPTAESGNAISVELLKDDMVVGRYYPIVLNVETNGAIVTIANIIGNPNLGISAAVGVINEIAVAAFLRDGAQVFGASPAIQISKATLLPAEAEYAIPLQGNAEVFRHSDETFLTPTLEGVAGRKSFDTAIPRGLQFALADDGSDPKYVLTNFWDMSGDWTIYFEFVYRTTGVTRWLFGADSAGANTSHIGFLVDAAGSMIFESKSAASTQTITKAAELVNGTRYRYKLVKDTAVDNKYYIANLTTGSPSAGTTIVSASVPSNANVTQFFFGGRAVGSGGGDRDACNSDLIALIVCNSHVTSGSAAQTAILGYLDDTRGLG